MHGISRRGLTWTCPTRARRSGRRPGRVPVQREPTVPLRPGEDRGPRRPRRHVGRGDLRRGTHLRGRDRDDGDPIPRCLLRMTANSRPTEATQREPRLTTHILVPHEPDGTRRPGAHAWRRPPAGLPQNAGRGPALCCWVSGSARGCLVRRSFCGGRRCSSDRLERPGHDGLDRGRVWTAGSRTPRCRPRRRS
jgi:hypothetical protein